MSEIIKLITSTRGFQIKCPNCGEFSDVKQANLFDIREEYPPKIKNFIIAIINNQKRISMKAERKIKKLNSELKILNKEKVLIKSKIKSKPKRVKTITRHINIGQIIEKILPGSRNFKFEQKDCRALFDPIDYIAFNGLTKSNKIDFITLIEIKSGDATLQRNQKNIKSQIENGKIKYLEY